MTRHYLDRLAEVIRTNWNQPALTDYATLDGGEGNSYTYGEMYGQICALCDRFHQLGIQKGDHIAICGANSANWVVAYLAIAAYSGVSVTILHSQTSEEITRQIDFADATTVIVDTEIWERLNQTQLSKVQHVLSLRDFTSLIDTIASPLVSLSFCPQDVSFDLQPLDTAAQICFTSGSTDQAKAAMLSFRNLSANVDYNFVLFSKYNKLHTISILPLSHIYGLVLEILQPLCLATHVHIYYIKSINDFLLALNKVRPAFVMLVPIMLSALINQCYDSRVSVLENRSLILHSLGGQIDLIGLGGAIISEKLENFYLSMQLPIATCYGMTECAPRIAVALPNELQKRSVGKLVPTLEVQILHNEILVRGENVMLGYYKDPEATAAKIDKDGWLHTGDRGHIDEEGNLYVEGRLNQDMVVLPSGENISLPNVETIINQVDGVEESLVLARNGHLVALVYASANLNRQDLLRTINPQLPSFSQLYDLEFVSAPFQRTEKRTVKRYLYQ